MGDQGYLDKLLWIPYKDIWRCFLYHHKNLRNIKWINYLNYWPTSLCSQLNLFICFMQGHNHKRFTQQKMYQFFRFFMKLARTKTQQKTNKASKHNRRTVFSTLFSQASTGSVKLVFIPLSYLNFNSSLFAPTSLFSSFQSKRYWYRRHDRNIVSVLLGKTSSPLPNLNPILQGGSTSFVECSEAGDRDGAFVCIRPLSFCWGWYNVVIFQSPPIILYFPPNTSIFCVSCYFLLLTPYHLPFLCAPPPPSSPNPALERLPSLRVVTFTGIGPRCEVIVLNLLQGGSYPLPKIVYIQGKCWEGTFSHADRI